MKPHPCRIVVLLVVLTALAAAAAWPQGVAVRRARSPRTLVWTEGVIIPFVYQGPVWAGGYGGCLMPGYPGGKWRWDEACGTWVQTAACAPCAPCCWAGPCVSTRKYMWADAPAKPCHLVRPCWAPCGGWGYWGAPCGWSIKLVDP